MLPIFAGPYTSPASATKANARTALRITNLRLHQLLNLVPLTQPRLPRPTVGVRRNIPLAANPAHRAVSDQSIDRLSRVVDMLALRTAARLRLPPKLKQSPMVMAQHAHPATLLTG